VPSAGGSCGKFAKILGLDADVIGKSLSCKVEKKRGSEYSNPMLLPHTYWCVCVFVSMLTTNHSSKTISSFAKDESNAREKSPLDGGSFPSPHVLPFNRQLARTVVLLTDKSNSPVSISISSISFY